MEHSLTLTDPASGADQIALTAAGMLAIGQILTGQGWSTVRQVTFLDGDQVTLRDLAKPITPADHTHAFTARSGAECPGCGTMRIPIAEILPVEGFSRTYIIRPSGEILSPDKWTVYLTGAGAEVRVARDGRWLLSAGNLPIVPELWPAWTLPEGLRRFIR